MRTGLLVLFLMAAVGGLLASVVCFLNVGNEKQLLVVGAGCVVAAGLFAVAAALCFVAEAIEGRRGA